MTDEDAQRARDLDLSVGELTRFADDETLSALTRLRTWDLLRQLTEERADFSAPDLRI